MYLKKRERKTFSDAFGNVSNDHPSRRFDFFFSARGSLAGHILMNFLIKKFALRKFYPNDFYIFTCVFFFVTKKVISTSHFVDISVGLMSTQLNKQTDGRNIFEISKNTFDRHAFNKLLSLGFSYKYYKYFSAPKR